MEDFELRWLPRVAKSPFANKIDFYSFSGKMEKAKNWKKYVFCKTALRTLGRHPKLNVLLKGRLKMLVFQIKIRFAIK